MKKSYLIIAAAALSLTACMQNEDLTFEEFRDVAIDFQSQGIEKATRAELNMDWFQTKGKKFGVYGFKKANMVEQIFDNEEVTCTVSGDPGEWSHNTVRFWDKSVNSYNFYAYAPYGSKTDVEFNNGFKFNNLEIFSNAASGDYDKAIAFKTGVGYSNGQLCNNGHGNAPTVPLVFNHVLSKLEFKVKTDVLADVATFYLKEIKAQFPTATASWKQSSATSLTGSADYGTITQPSLVVVINASGDVAASGDADDCDKQVYTTSEASGDAITNSGVQYGNTYIVVPVDDEDEEEHKMAVMVKYDVVYNDGTTETDCVALGAVKYAPNSNDFYTITININPAQIEFCVEGLEGWTEKDGGEFDVE